MEVTTIPGFLGRSKGEAGGLKNERRGCEGVVVDSDATEHRSALQPSCGMRMRMRRDILGSGSRAQASQDSTPAVVFYLALPRACFTPGIVLPFRSLLLRSEVLVFPLSVFFIALSCSVVVSASSSLALILLPCLFSLD